MRVFVVKAFSRFQRREKITDPMLCTALDNARKGLIDAELGGEVIKQRVARKGQGKNGALIAFRGGKRAVGVGRNKAVAALRRSAQAALRDAPPFVERGGSVQCATAYCTLHPLDDEKIERAIADDELREVHCDQGTEKA